MKILVFILLWLPIVTCCQDKGAAIRDSGWIYSALWGKNGELWNRQRLPDFTNAGYRKNRVPLPSFPVLADITRYGGKGDGITDNTPALRAAIQQCGANGTVYIPAGNYHFKDTIVIRKSGVCIRGAGTAATTLFFEKGLEELYPNYNVGYPNQSSWSWSGAMILFDGPASEVGIENLSIRFPDRPWAGHTYDERGYNAIGFSSGAHDGWAQNIRLTGCDMGIWIEHSAHHITARNWVLDFEAIRGSQVISGHHGINITGSYNLLEDFELKGKYQHDLSVEMEEAKYNVFRNGKGKDLAIDHHNHAQSYNLFTNLDAGSGTRLYFSGGVSTPRGICFKETFWNISAVNNMSYCDQHDDATKQSAGNNCVGIKTVRTSEITDAHNNWFETIQPGRLFPQDLYLAQMEYVERADHRNAPAAVIVIRNDQSFGRQKEIISIGSKQFGAHTTATYPLVTCRGGINVSQPVDADKDGLWDSLFIEVSLLPHAKDTLSLIWTDHPLREEQQVTNVRLSCRSTNGLPAREITDTFRRRGYVQDIGNPTYQMEGPGIENDKVAFRVFFDQRNGKDVYGKLTTAPVLETVGLKGSWHQLQDWGMDILKTGNSMGAGNFAVRQAETDYPLADADSTVFTQLYEGPLAASFRLDFYNWDAGRVKQKGSEVLTMLKGNYYYTTTLYLSLQKRQTLLQGFAHFYQDSPMVSSHNRHYVSVSTFGKQAEGDTSSLGLAIMVPRSRFLGSGKQDNTGKLPNSCYVQMRTPGSISSLFFACWGRTDVRFKEEAGFVSYLREVASRLEHPIRITMSTKL